MSRNMRSQENQAASHMRPKHNKSSSLLTHEENEAVFKMLGRKCQVFISNLSSDQYFNEAYLRSILSPTSGGCLREETRRKDMELLESRLLATYS
uniref:Uncharacterized protein n=1 Tax=Glossina morsitans morsitans TaxID=37546 RepID=A0A1B0FQN3_GLOMM